MPELREILYLKLQGLPLEERSREWIEKFFDTVIKQANIDYKLTLAEKSEMIKSVMQEECDSCSA